MDNKKPKGLSKVAIDFLKMLQSEGMSLDYYHSMYLSMGNMAHLEKPGMPSIRIRYDIARKIIDSGYVTADDTKSYEYRNYGTGRYRLNDKGRAYLAELAGGINAG